MSLMRSVKSASSAESGSCPPSCMRRATQSGKEMIAAHGIVKAERSQAMDRLSRRTLRIESQIVTLEKSSQPSIGTAEVEHEYSRTVLLRLQQEKIEVERLPRAGAPHKKRMPDVGSAEEVVEIPRRVAGLEDRNRWRFEMTADRLSLRGSEHRSHGRRGARRDEQWARQILGRTARPTLEVDCGLAKTLPDELPVHLSKDPRETRAGLIQSDGVVGRNENRESDLAVGNPLRLDLDACRTELFHMGTGRGGPRSRVGYPHAAGCRPTRTSGNSGNAAEYFGCA